MDSIALLILRIGLGTIFIAHGSQKLFGAFGGGGIQEVSAMVKNMGFLPPVFWAYALAISEALGGLLVILGFLPRIGAGLIAIVMLVAIFKVHLAKGFFAAQGGFEYQLLILAVCLSLIISGAGNYSLFNKY